MRRPLVYLAPLLLLPCASSAQSKLRVCVVQGANGSGASAYAAELSARGRLSDGLPVAAYVVFADKDKQDGGSTADKCDAAEKGKQSGSLPTSFSGSHHYTPCVNCVFLFAAYGSFSNKDAVRVCVVQQQEFAGGSDLAAALSKRKLQDGSPIVTTSMTATAKLATAEVERQGCEYTVQFWRHDNVDSLDNPPAGIPSSGAPSVAPMGDRDYVGYRLRESGTTKVLAGGSAPPSTVYSRQGHRAFDPYEKFAAELVNKLNKIRR